MYGYLRICDNVDCVDSIFTCVYVYYVWWLCLCLCLCLFFFTKKNDSNNGNNIGWLLILSFTILYVVGVHIIYQNLNIIVSNLTVIDGEIAGVVVYRLLFKERNEKR